MINVNLSKLFENVNKIGTQMPQINSANFNVWDNLQKDGNTIVYAKQHSDYPDGITLNYDSNGNLTSQNWTVSDELYVSDEERMYDPTIHNFIDVDADGDIDRYLVQIMNPHGEYSEKYAFNENKQLFAKHVENKSTRTSEYYHTENGKTGIKRQEIYNKSTGMSMINEDADGDGVFEKTFFKKRDEE